jgi:hypothetical protein
MTTIKHPATLIDAHNLARLQSNDAVAEKDFIIKEGAIRVLSFYTQN